LQASPSPERRPFTLHDLRPQSSAALSSAFAPSSAGLLPIMWSHGTEAEVMQRIAVPIFVGMVSSTLLTLIVIRAIYALVGDCGHIAASGFGLRRGFRCFAQSLGLERPEGSAPSRCRLCIGTSSIISGSATMGCYSDWIAATAHGHVDAQ
jgi:hypothetical protein